TRDTVDLADLDHADDFFTFLWRKHAGHRVAHVVDRIVNDIVVTQVYAVVLGQFLRALLGAHVKADDYGTRSNCQVDVAFRDAADRCVYNLYPHFVGGQLEQRGNQRLLRTLHIGLDDKRKGLRAFTDIIEHRFELGCLLARQLDVAELALTEQRDFTRLAFVDHGDDLVASRRHFRKTLYFYRN